MTDQATTTATVSLTVMPAVLTVTANPQTKVYGTSDPALTYGVSGLQLRHTAAGVLTGALTRAGRGDRAGSPYAIARESSRARQPTTPSTSRRMFWRIHASGGDGDPANASKIYARRIRS